MARLLLVMLTSLLSPLLPCNRDQLVFISAIWSAVGAGGGSGLMQEAWAASLRLVAANDVLISAAYKVNPITASHTAGEQNNKEARGWDLHCERASKCHSGEFKSNRHTQLFRLSWRLSGCLDVSSWLCFIVYKGFNYVKWWTTTEQNNTPQNMSVAPITSIKSLKRWHIIAQNIAVNVYTDAMWCTCLNEWHMAYEIDNLLLMCLLTEDGALQINSLANDSCSWRMGAGNPTNQFSWQISGPDHRLNSCHLL